MVISLKKLVLTMELWDAYDEKLNKIEGVTLIRGETIPEGMFHLVSEIFDS